MRIAVAALCLAGCFSPDVTTGAPCSASGACPGELECAPETLTCERPEPDDGCYGSFGEICIPTPDEPLEYEDTTIDTDDDDDCLGSSVIPYCIVAGTTVEVSEKLRAHGSRPLVLIATLTMKIKGTLDVSSHRGSDDLGAGADPFACAAMQAPDIGGAGAGGSFGGRGGVGGIGEVLAARVSQPAAPVIATELRGGCYGGDGSGGDGGHGGGAVYLIARRIEVTGVINASGASGSRSSENDAGGGGGGSGGMIVLDANVIEIAGQVFANGGAGGAGNNQNADAEDPKSALERARGGEDKGDESGNTGDGGDGAAADVLDGSAGGSGSDGGGGGGGGAGVIRVLMRELPEGSIRGAISPTAR